MQRQIGSPATAWQAKQANMTTYDRATPSAEREIYTLPETIALNSQSEQSLRDAVEVKSSPYLGSVALTNDRQSKLLQSAHLAIADQSPFKLRSSEPKVSIQSLSTSQEFGSSSQGLVEVSSSTVSVPLPPRTTYDAYGKPFSGQAEGTVTSGDVVAANVTANVAGSVAQETHGLKLAAISADGERAHASFNAAPVGQSPDLVDTNFSQAGFLNAAWGLSETNSGSGPGSGSVSAKHSLNSLFPNAGNSLKKASVSFDAGLPTAKPAANLVTDNGLSKISRAGDALNTGRITTQNMRVRDFARIQDCEQLPLFDITSARNKFLADNVDFSKSISPSGERTQVQTAPDFSSLTEVWTPTTSGAYLYKSVYRDELNRVRFEESVDAQGQKTVIQTGYCDKEEKKSPFVAYKMMVKPDGSRQLLA
jgi:hypothetical protein